MRTICLTLCFSMLMYSIAPHATADNGTGKRRAVPMSEQENRELAARAALTPSLEKFEAGDTTIDVLIGLLIIVALVALIYFLIVRAQHRSYPEKPAEAPAPPGQPAPQNP